MRGALSIKRVLPSRAATSIRACVPGSGSAGVHYVDLLEPSEGHDICAGDDAWVNGVVTDPERATGLHPFAEEQQAVADLVVEALAAD